MNDASEFFYLLQSLDERQKAKLRQTIRREKALQAVRQKKPCDDGSFESRVRHLVKVHRIKFRFTLANLVTSIQSL